MFWTGLLIGLIAGLVIGTMYHVAVRATWNKGMVKAEEVEQIVENKVKDLLHKG